MKPTRVVERRKSPVAVSTVTRAMSEEDRDQNLDAAARMLVEVAESLDDGGHVCGECGLMKRTNFDEATSKEALLAAAKKVRRVRAKLRHEDVPNEVD